VSLLAPHSQNMLELVHRCLADEERTDSLMRLSYGLIGDLADCFPNGQLKQLLLANWIASELRSRHRMPDETKKTMRWAREVSDYAIDFVDYTDHPFRWLNLLPSRLLFLLEPL